LLKNLAIESDSLAENQNLEKLNKELGALAPQAEEKRRSAKPKKKAPKQKVIITKSKRKEAVARARLTKGNGKIKINGVDVNLIKPKELRELILEPVNFSNITKEIAESSDIIVNVKGGGASGQAQAARNAIAKAIAAASSSEIVRKAYMRYDRALLIDDARRVEPKKFLGPKARARFQTSYR
jgi:small subunit ribosomal protein S9